MRGAHMQRRMYMCDSKDRGDELNWIFSRRWRTKQNLDFSFLMLYAQNKGTYYVQVIIKINLYSCDLSRMYNCTEMWILNHVRLQALS